MGRKKDQLRGFVEEIKEEIRESKDDGAEEATVIPTEELPESMKTLLTSFPSAEGYFGKIYKVEQNGDWQLKDYRIESPETIPDGDLEGEVKRIVKQKQWGNGDYRVQIRRQGERSIYLNKKIVVNETPFQGHDSPIREQFGMLREAADVIERFKPTPISPEMIGNTILKAVETGRNMAQPQSGNGQDLQLGLILQLAEKFLPALMNKPTDIDAVVEKVVLRLQAIQPKEDLILQLAKVKDALGMKFAHEVKEHREDSLDSVKKVAEIVSAIKPLTQAASGEPTSTLGLVFEHLPRLIEPLLTTFKEFAEAKKMEMQLRMDQYYGGGAGVSQPARIEGDGRERNLPAPRIHPFAVRIIESVNKNDESYFDMMRQQILRLYGQHVIEGLIDGNLTAELLIETINTELGVPLNLPNLKPYLDKFVKYLQSKDELGSGRGVLAECKTCHAQYDFKDLKQWEADEKKCEDCKGELELVKREGEA